MGIPTPLVEVLKSKNNTLHNTTGLLGYDLQREIIFSAFSETAQRGGRSPVTALADTSLLILLSSPDEDGVP